MKHFILEGEHLVPFEQRDPAMIAAHRAFLQEGYERGDFLISGPTVPPTGGFGRVSEKVSHGSGGVVLLRATAIGGQWLA